MSSIARFPKSAVAATIVCLAGSAIPALAQCHLAVDAAPKILVSGESAQVNVRAHFAATDYAWASAQFDVLGTDPGWTFASAGVIALTDVFAINVWQNHQPHIGLPADPENPIRIWTGQFSPVSPAPALVKFAAAPGPFSVYPSPLTASSVPCVATGGSDTIFVNPLFIGQIAAAPGRGTTIEVVGDQFVAEADPEEAILIGLLLPAVQKVREAAARMEFQDRPASLTIAAQAHASSDVPIEEFTLNFEEIRATGLYELDLALPPGYRMTYQLSLNGVPVRAFSGSAGRAPFLLEQLPDVFIQRAEPLESGPTTRQRGGAIEMIVLQSEVPARVFLDGGLVVLADTVEVRTQCQNNLKQIGLGLHTYQATGVSTMRVTPVVR